MDSIANGYGCRPCKIKQVQLDVTDAIIHFIGDGSSLSHLNASNVDFGTLSTSVFPVSGVTAGTYGSSSNVSQVTIDQYGRVTNAANVTVVSSQWTGDPGSSIYYIPGVGVGSSSPATANLQVTGNMYVSNALTTTNVFATTYYGDGGLLSNVGSQWTGNKGSPIYYIPGVSVGSSSPATANLQVTGNVYVSNAVTTPNVNVDDTLVVTGAMTSNAANTTFLFDTFTIPYINTQYLNVSSTTIMTGNLVTSNAITTTNLFANTLTLSGMTGKTTLNVTDNVSVSNALTTTNVFAATEVLTGTAGQTSLNVTGNVYVSNALTTTNVFATTANVGTLNVWQVSNLVTLSVTNNLYAANAITTTNVFAATEVLTGTAGQTSLNVTGNVTVSNALTTTNIFAAGFTSNVSNTNFFYSTLTVPFVYATTLNVASTANVLTASIQGSTGQTSLAVTGNVTVSNALTTTNVFTTNVFATGQVTAAGRTGVGVCTPMIFRQGAAGANWNTPAANTSTVAVTSGAVQMQCGANTMVTTTQFIPFPVSYTGNPVVLVTSYGTHGNIWVASITSTNFSVSANTAQQFEWLSIGI